MNETAIEEDTLVVSPLYSTEFNLRAVVAMHTSNRYTHELEHLINNISIPLLQIVGGDIVHHLPDVDPEVKQVKWRKSLGSEVAKVSNLLSQTAFLENVH
jgi:hypothetical protein